MAMSFDTEKVMNLVTNNMSDILGPTKFTKES